MGDEPAIRVRHHSWGNGRVVPGQIRVRDDKIHMDIMFEHGIEKNVALMSVSLLEPNDEANAYLIKYLNR